MEWKTRRRRETGASPDGPHDPHRPRDRHDRHDRHEDTQEGRAALGRRAEDLALELLEPRGLSLLARNYRVARGPAKRGGEIDLVLRDRDGTLVFVEVRARRDGSLVGAAASIDARKRRRILYAARCYIASLACVPPCRFDVVTVDGARVEWLRAAFDAD